jgi:hypothetical protein
MLTMPANGFRVIRHMARFLCLSILLNMLSGMCTEATTQAVPAGTEPANREALYAIGTLLPAASYEKTTVLLAQVLRMEKSQVRDEEHLARKVHFRVVEVLSGKYAPAWLNIDNEPMLERNRRSSVSKIPVPTSRAAVGQYWVVIYRSEAGPNDYQIFIGTRPVSGPDDLLVALFRRHVAWINRRDVPDALQEMRTVLLDPRETFQSRLAVFCSLGKVVRGKHLDIWRSPYHPFYLQTLVDLLKQKSLPAVLEQSAMLAVSVDPLREIESGSREAFLVRYLMDRLKKETDDMVADMIGDHLGHLAWRMVEVNGKWTIFHYPEIIQALQRRIQADCAKSPSGRSFVSRTIYNLELQGYGDPDRLKDREIVDRRLPWLKQ